VASNKQVVAVARVDFTHPTRLAEPLRWLLRILGAAAVLAGALALRATARQSWLYKVRV
jgi:hypothetical protein